MTADDVPGTGANGPLAPFTLTKPQREVATASVDQRSLVLAGPGAGKTHVVAAKLADLVLQQGCRPRSEVLLLSYTRAAVREMKDRLRDAAEAADAPRVAHVNILTMDSFGHRLHVASGEEYPGGSGYTEAIKAATRLLRNNDEAKAAVGEYRHVIVDEAQDLIGHRDIFIRNILKNVGGGFTILSDPNQAIYDYLLEEEDVPMDTGFEYLKRWMEQRWDMETRKLPGTHRHVGQTKKVLDRADRIMGHDELDWPDRYESILDLVRDEDGVLDVGPPASKSRLTSLLEDLEGDTAVLTRTNGEVLALSDHLMDAGVFHHRIAGSGNVPHAPGWVGRILPYLPETFSRKEVVEAWEELVGEPMGAVNDGHDAFELLSRAGHRPRRDLVSKQRVIEALENPHFFPPEASYEGCVKRPILLSTVHRAKGREFDNVILVEPSRPDEDNGYEMGYDDYPMETRVLYVALSRPKEFLRSARFSAYCSKFQADGTGVEERWYQKPFNAGMPAKVEVHPEDVSHFESIHKGGMEAQRIMWDYLGLDGGFLKARPRHPRTWNLTINWDKAPDVKMGSLKTSAVTTFKMVGRKCRWKRVTGLTDVWVEGLATVAGRAPANQRVYYDQELLDRGYWLVPVIRGFATMWGKGR